VAGYSNNPIYARKEVGTKWLCIVEFEVSQDGLFMAGLSETVEF